MYVIQDRSCVHLAFQKSCPHLADEGYEQVFLYYPNINSGWKKQVFFGWKACLMFKWAMSKCHLVWQDEASSFIFFRPQTVRTIEASSLQTETLSSHCAMAQSCRIKPRAEVPAALFRHTENGGWRGWVQIAKINSDAQVGSNNSDGDGSNDGIKKIMTKLPEMTTPLGEGEHADNP